MKTYLPAGMRHTVFHKNVWKRAQKSRYETKKDLEKLERGQKRESHLWTEDEKRLAIANKEKMEDVLAEMQTEEYQRRSEDNLVIYNANI